VKNTPRSRTLTHHYGVVSGGPDPITGLISIATAISGSTPHVRLPQTTAAML
jgi:hypothetical protein